VKHCKKCKLFTPKARTPPTPLHHVATIGTFCKRDIDFMECNPVSVGGHKYSIVAINYFTKWAEAMLTYNNTTATVACFFLNHVITRFGVSKQLLSDHGTHFEDVVWKELSSLFQVEHQFSSAYYPHGNGQVEAVNKVLKTMLQWTVDMHKSN
jgi:hypothetical protein